MRNRDTRGFHHSSTEGTTAFDEEDLERDVLSELSGLLANGREFTGHDGRRYMIRGSAEEESESESFIDVVVKFDQGSAIAARYAILLQRISR
jgi:hypothetical protein